LIDFAPEIPGIPMRSNAKSAEKQVLCHLVVADIAISWIAWASLTDPCCEDAATPLGNGMNVGHTTTVQVTKWANFGRA
jgi:hypothetical protein